METLLLILTIGFAFFTCITAAFGIGGMGSAKKSIRGWILPLFIATLVSAYLYGGTESLIAVGIITVLVALVLTAMVNKRHGGIRGISYDDQLKQIANTDVDDMLARIASKNKH